MAYSATHKEQNSLRSKNHRAANLLHYKQMAMKNAKKRSSEISKNYVKGLLGIRTPSEELIEVKRAQLQLHRLTKQLNQVIKDAQK